MTWHYVVSRERGELTVYDHTGAEIAVLSGTALSVPGSVLELMEQEVMAEGLQGGLSDRQIAILRDAVFENIERGTPP